ncbi:MAG: hypothetical protein JSR09_07275 [Bacteroidetes bacterium]|nr:hypothetical protein [Bacteroidota bacterium]MBS1649495.1 hypothetical protein [Bacteroidota bacterium]
MTQKNTTSKNIFQQTTTIRIVAFWAFSEAFLGGILHGFQIPLSGLVLASIASLCITLIALANTSKGIILKATLVVIAVKFILSPYTPPMAYLAVLVQGIAGELFFMQRKFIKVTTFCLTLFSLIYSALQQLITLTIIFGKSFWKGLDVFLNKITQSFISQQHYSLYIVVIYLLCYVLAGIFGGIFNVYLIEQFKQNKLPENFNNALELLNANNSTYTNLKQKKKKNNFIIIGIILLCLLLISYIPFLQQNLLKGKILPIVVRGIFIILIWMYLLAPLFIKLISKWVQHYKKNNRSVIENILLLMPDIKNIVMASWQASKELRFFKRIKNFIFNSLMLALYEKS